ncbi:uncharacterized protein LOC127103192 [Lathyrus oleraceus]|uniref:uncharacterized protein LOC127103192 n=1 Tax=Pisum sativum TaxID=3888 RepID=UPI0021D104F6|nr:uncharacterized protein LOC127103192 [Pisum sativum]
MAEFSSVTGSKLLTSGPYYAQAKGQVEAANKILIGLIKKSVGQKSKNCHKTLNQVLWACRSSPKDSTKYTPFLLVYGHEIMLPLDIYLHLVRIQRQFEIPIEFYFGMMFDKLAQLDEDKLTALDILVRPKERVAKAYNKRVKSKIFNEDDLVWKVILHMD